MGVVTPRRLGIFGGTFDPIHRGHLIAAGECLTRLDLDQIWFVPVGDPPHKRGRIVSPAADRVAMVELAIAGNPRFHLSRCEVDRPGASYSVDTVRQIRAEVGPAAELFFIIGQDSLLDLPRWRQPEQLLALCQIVAVNRPGYPRIDLSRLGPVIAAAKDRITFIEIPAFDVAASEVRRRVAAGDSIEGLVPEAVQRYIEAHGLYRRGEFT